VADEEQQGAGAEGGGQPTEEEIHAQLEEEIRNVRIEDLILQSVVSILNLSARRIAKDDERDLEQAKVGIDAGRALVDLVKPEAQPQLRQAISELQLLYAKHAGEEDAPEGGPEGGESGPEGGESGSEGADSGPARGPSEPPEGGPGLWTPPGT
jgi:hypothetical protein